MLEYLKFAGPLLAQTLLQTIAESLVDQLIEQTKGDKNIRKTINPLRLDSVLLENGSVHDITVDGILTLHRKGDVKMSLENETMLIKATLGLFGVGGEACYAYKAAKLLPVSGMCSGRVETISLTMILTMNLKTSATAVETIMVSDFTGVEVTKFTGTSAIFNWLVQKVLQGTANKKRGAVLKALEAKGKIALDQGLANMDTGQLLPPGLI